MVRTRTGGVAGRRGVRPRSSDPGGGALRTARGAHGKRLARSARLVPVNVNDLLIESFDRLPDLVRSAVNGLTPAELRWSPAPGANSVGWLVWHLARVQDHHV